MPASQQCPTPVTRLPEFRCCRAAAVAGLRGAASACRRQIIPVESILKKLPVVPIGDTGAIPFAMRQNARDFVDAAFDSKEGSGDGIRWWYINTWALSWSSKRFEK